MSKTPPKYPLHFFRWFCNPDYAEDIEGDLMERFIKRTNENRAAKWLFTTDVLKLFRPGIIRSFEGSIKLNYYGMLKHNLLIALRSFKRYRSSFLINLIGLSTGLACVLLIYLWVSDEMNIDKFHLKDSNLYMVMGNYEKPDRINTWNGMPAPLAQALEEEFPEIDKAVSSTDPSWNIVFNVSAYERKLKSIGKYASKNYFHLFSYDLIQGDAQRVLSDRNSIVISDRLAQKLFKDEKDIVGRTIDWESTSDKGHAVISGVFEAPPTNSTDQFDFLLPYDLYLEEQQNWYAPISVCYVLLNDGADLASLNARIKPFLESKAKDSNVSLFLKKYSDNYLYGDYENGILVGGRIQYIKLFSIIAVFILAIACVNFMNLSTARASRRIKELGVKKASGASRGSLIFQYLSESILMSFISLVASLILASLFIPYFNRLTDKELFLSNDLSLIVTSVLVTFITGLVAGSYPAFYLSGFNPAIVLKGKLKNSLGELWIRKGLVVFQFSISIILIVSVYVVHRQVQFVQGKHLGYAKERLIQFESNGKISENFDTFITELKNIPGVENASGITNGMFGAPGGELYWDGNSSADFSRFIVYYDFIETLGLTVEQGQSFSREYTGEAKIIINKSAAQTMGLAEPVGTKVKFWGNNARIVGVVNDFHFSSLHKDIEPLFMHLFPPKYLTNIIVRLESKDHLATIERLKEFYSEFNPGYDLDYSFLNDEYQNLYKSENKVGQLSKYFAGIAILISCLGLFGLAAFTAERKVKEIGIRKILGSSEFQIVRILSTGFIKIVFIAILIGLPASYLITKEWLMNFAYKIDLKWWFFIGAGLIALIITLITVAFQTVKAARTNPVHSLKYE